MTYYVCKQCNYKHTFLPLACAKCKGTNFYLLVTSEPTGNTSICKGMEIQEDVLKLRIEKEQLETENNKLLDVINNQDVKIADLEKENAGLDMKRKAERQIFQGIVEKKNEQLTKAKEIIKNCIHILKHSGTALDWKTVINQAEQFLKEIEK